MIYIRAFIVCGLICMIAQLIYDHTTWTPGHITSLFVVLGVVLDLGGLYDRLIEFAGAGALLPITSFGYSLMHAGMEGIESSGLIGLFTGMLKTTSAGIVFAVALSCLAARMFRSRW